MDMALIVVRYLIGYVLQVLPCALLCLLPFTQTMKHSRRQVALRVFLAIAITCIVFVAVSLTVFEPFVYERITFSNVLFLALLVVLFLLFWCEVHTNNACKAFVFLISMAYGAIVTLTVYVVGQLIGLPEITDLRLYSPAKLTIFAVLEAVTFPPVWIITTRVVRPLVQEGFTTKVWIRFCVIPVGMFLLLVLIYWLPTQSMITDKTELIVLIGILILGAVAVFAWAVILLRDFRRMRKTYNDMAQHVEVLKQKHFEQQCVQKTDQSKATITENAKVVFETPAKVLALEVSSIRYLEVFGHKLVIHLVNRRTEQLSLSLTQARSLLPENQFIQCHRSYVVNKDAVQSLRRYELTLKEGELVPVSKQRYHEVEAALLSS